MQFCDKNNVNNYSIVFIYSPQKFKATSICPLVFIVFVSVYLF